MQLINYKGFFREKEKSALIVFYIVKISYNNQFIDLDNIGIMLSKSNNNKIDIMQEKIKAILYQYNISLSK